jgi:predicted transposase/invertase (TIGR01784 family)
MQATPHDYLVKRTRYYQDLIDLDQIEKGQKYNELNRSLIIFVCTYDPFGLGRHIYSFKNLCSEDTNLALEDGTEKIFVNTVGTMDDVDATFQDVMNFFNGFAPQGVFAKQLQEEVKRVKESEKWRREYMTLEIFMDDARTEERKIGREEGLQEGRSRYLIEQVYKKYRKGQSSDAIAEDLLEDSSLVQRIVDEIEKHQSGGTCDIDALYSELYGERE